MFGNFINRHDVIDIFKKGYTSFSKLTENLTSSNEEKVKQTWAVTDYPETNWWDIPEVQRRWNRLISGDEKLEYYEYISKKYFKNRSNLVGLSLGCGTGHRELKWAQCGGFVKIEAVDISKPRILMAIEEAKSKGFDSIIEYKVADIYKTEMPKSYYDAIFAEQSLHHFSPLNELLHKINKSLKPEGYFILNEFVGPTRFQWTDRQLEVVNGLLSIMPNKYKKLFKGETIKPPVFSPSKLRMQLTDPSEAIEASNIIPMIKEVFDMVEIKPYGGTILHLLFAGIGHNFISSDPEVKNWLKIFFEIEDQLLSEKELSSDFVVAVCKKRLDNA